MSDIKNLESEKDRKDRKKSKQSKQSKLTTWQITLIALGSLVLLAIVSFFIYKYTAKPDYKTYYFNTDDKQIYHDPEFDKIVKFDIEETHKLQYPDGTVHTILTY